MDLLPSDEQSHIIDAIRQFLVTEMPLQRLQTETQSVADDHDYWPAMAELGWLGIALHERLGGSNLSLLEEMLLCNEAGRQLISPTLISTLLGAHLAAQSGEEELAAKIIAGGFPVALAVSTGPSQHEGADVSGEFMVVGRCGSRLTCDYLFLLSPQYSSLLHLGPDLSLTCRPCIDETLSLEQVVLEGTRPVAVQQGDVLYRHAMLLSAALSTGMAEQLRDLGVRHAKEREQFGHPIGSFQAIKHSCANMALRCEAALSMVTQAWLEFVDNDDAAHFDSYAAELMAIDAAQQNAEAAIHIYGAMGFSRETPPHNFLKRSQVLAALFGNSRQLLTSISFLPTPT